MKISPHDLEGSRSIAIVDVIEYLRATGWKNIEIYSDRAAVWESPGQEIEIHIPLRQQAGDYNQLLATAINQVARMEKRPPQQVLADLRIARADVVRVRRIGQDADGQLPLVDGASLFSAAANLLIAAASAAVEPRSAYPGRRPQSVQDFSRQALFGQTEVGSFVVKVVVPLPVHLASRQLPLPIEKDGFSPDPAERPFNRQVTETLMHAVASAQRAATQAMIDSSLDGFTTAISDGVSADLCKALAAMARRESRADQVEISVNWSPVWPTSLRSSRPVGFGREMLEVLDSAATFLGEVAQKEEFEIAGFVTHLHREPQQGPGEITLLGRVDERLRPVKIQLEEREYGLALQAHEHESSLALVGDLRKEGGRYRLDNPHRVRLVANVFLVD